MYVFYVNVLSETSASWTFVPHKEASHERFIKGFI